jgi:hypothetical protein
MLPIPVNMSLREDVRVFLSDFKQKAKVYDIEYYPRQINTDTLLNLAISAQLREDFIMNLTVEDYFQGPTKDQNPKRPDYYEFGITVKGQEIYIKLSLGRFGKSPHCMSFHLAQQPMNYPLKNTNHGSK